MLKISNKFNSLNKPLYSHVGHVPLLKIVVYDQGKYKTHRNKDSTVVCPHSNKEEILFLRRFRFGMMLLNSSRKFILWPLQIATYISIHAMWYKKEDF